MVGAAQFAWQHDIQEPPTASLRIFDNEAAPRVRDESRALFLGARRRGEARDARREA